MTVTDEKRWTVETEMLVARTLYDDIWRYDQDNPDDDLGPFDDLDPEDQEGWLKSVRLALAALDKVGLLVLPGGLMLRPMTVEEKEADQW